ncbi:hypothetical protein HNQ08_000501 [Deinococcus humi]|uniref:Uncharacterized protein n=1 Tax=Deinococcus humi TaxID=662880 RepID=A0A7W8JQM6_9DEIO|nr:hypothetical protein [Deinococcus humi]
MLTGCNYQGFTPTANTKLDAYVTARQQIRQ